MKFSYQIFSASPRLCGLLLFTIHFSLLTANAQTRDYAKWVNQFIGTGGHGHTFPGATMPFGMVQLSPDTRIDDWDGSSGYHYSDDIIYGFSHTHLSGTGIPDGCDILFMPVVDDMKFFYWPGEGSGNGAGTKFSHNNERAEPGYYSVRLDDGIQAELTATERVGFHRYQFPKGELPFANIILNLKWRDKALETQITKVGVRRVEGFRRSSSWAKNQRVYFVAEFSQPFTAIGGFTHATEEEAEKVQKFKRSFRFDSPNGTQVLVKVAISNVSIEGARKNLEAELPHWDFDKVRADAKAAWNKELSKIEVSGGTDDQTTTFYTALYHTMIHPNVFNDVDGRYKGMDGKIYSLRDERQETGDRRQETKTQGQRPKAKSAIRDPQSQYTVFSLWDTFRAAHPLYTIIDQKRTVDFINTFIRQYEQGGRLPVWELWGEETDTMIGYHSVSVIADAMAKGIKGFDYEKAYAAAKHSAELDHHGLAAYKRRGYISMEDENESVSKTLEYAYDDWCIWRMAEVMAKNEFDKLPPIPPGKTVTYRGGPMGKGMALLLNASKYQDRARFFENLFDPSTGFMRPKKNGGFVSPFAPNEVTFNFTEGNSWVYSFFVPHDINRLMELQGGREKFAAKLDELFTTKDKLAGREQPDITGLIGQYAHGNEPSHHIAYLYDYAHQPWKTQKLVRKIMDEFYKPEPDGLIGNEDCGQMSAWYIMSASGIYEVTPGSAIYAFGTPLFPEIKYNLENGKTFTIRAKNVSSANKYILNAKLNGAPYKKAFITHEDIMNGGVLEFVMIDSAVTTAFTEFPVSTTDSDFVAVPAIQTNRSVFVDQTTITLGRSAPETDIYFTKEDIVEYRPPAKGEPVYLTDGVFVEGYFPMDEAIKYTGPFVLKGSTKITAIAVNKAGTRSKIVDAVFRKRPNDWTVKIDSKYNRQYTGGGDEGLIDGIRGTVNFASGEWQGYQGQDFVAVIDMGVERDFTEVGGSFLQVARSWIWMPTRIEVEAMLNGESYEKIAEIVTDVPVTEMTPTIREYKKSGPPLRARYVRVHAYNLGKIPAWHPGAGFDAFIFVDELFVR
jgi:putative alpha-1,2-mannosidase